MSEFYIGSVGWEHAEWDGSYYPDDLPAQWRLSFYANEFHAVVVPFLTWSAASPVQWTQWLEDTPERFRFFLQLPAMEDAAFPALNAVARETGEILANRMGGFITTAAAGRIVDSNLQGLGSLSVQWPVAILVQGPRLPGMLSKAERYGISVCWEEGGVPQATGRFAVSSCPEDPEPRSLRALIEGLARAAGPHGIALLVCPGKVSSIALMHAGNTIAGLLGL